MKLKCPKGILILALFTLVASISSIKYVFNPQGKLAFCNFILQGEMFRVYYIFIIGLGIFVSIGLFLLKKWAYVIFIFQQLLFIILVICNILFTEKSTLLKAGWKDSEQLLSGYRLVMCIAVLIGVAFIIWVTSYRRYFVGSKRTT